MRKLKLTNEYGCWPLWEVDDGPPRNLSPQHLGLPPQLCERLDAWAQQFEATLDHDYPPDSGFAGAAEAAAFVEEGRRLAAAVQSTLSDVTVAYLPHAHVRSKP